MFVTAFLLVSAQTAAAQPAAATPSASTVAEAPRKEKKICRVDDADSGSHMVHRLCLTAQEWQERGQRTMGASRSGISGKATDY